jgi:hypothetical protein
MARAKKRSRRKKKFDIESYVKKNKTTSLIVAALVLFLAWWGWSSMTSNPNEAGYSALPSTTLPRYIPGVNYITSGEWKATKFFHDTGREGLNGSWESTEDGFGYLISMNYLSIREGSYNVTYRIKIENNTIKSDQIVIGIEVARNKGFPVVGMPLYISDFKESNVYQDFTIRLDTMDPLNDAELRAHFDHGPVKVTIEKVTLTPIKQ